MLLTTKHLSSFPYFSFYENLPIAYYNEQYSKLYIIVLCFLYKRNPIIIHICFNPMKRAGLNRFIHSRFTSPNFAIFNDDFDNRSIHKV